MGLGYTASSDLCTSIIRAAPAAKSVIPLVSGPDHDYSALYVPTVDLIEREKQNSDPVGRGAPIGQTLIIVDQPIEGDLHGDEGRRGLGQLTQRHGAGQAIIADLPPQKPWHLTKNG